jgi:hypothetical protein
MPRSLRFARNLAAPACLWALLSCASADAPPAETARVQDRRVFAIDHESLSFDALPGLASDRLWGVWGRAAYRIEIPAAWNGMLVMYAHGHRQQTDLLTVSTPGLREHLLRRGYAWAASSYSANYYDVRAGLEDTNALANAFTALAVEHGLGVSEPSRTYIFGRSMGGHVAAAAVERETLATERNPRRYQGALAMCGVLADAELVNYYAAYGLALFALAERPATRFPIPDYAAALPAVRDALFARFPDQLSQRGAPLLGLLMNLSGGARPGYVEAFPSWQDRLLQLGAGHDDLSAVDLNGVLSGSILDTTRIEYRFGDEVDPAIAAAFEARIPRVAADPDANPPRSDGVRWLPVLHGELDVPVITLHDLGDLFVPFRMVQIYAERAAAQGSGALLVQRAIRAIEHCDFSPTEESEAFDALTEWDQHGVVPAGDPVLDAAALRAPEYGCAFTRDQTPLPATRSVIPRCN